MKKKLATILSLIIVSIAFSQVKEKEMPPEGGKPKSFTVPKKDSSTLANGLKIITIPYGLIPKVTISAIIKTGNIHETTEEIWLSDLMGHLLKEGTELNSAEEISKKFADMGGELRINVNPLSIIVECTVLAEFATEAVEQLGNIITSPKLPESELERLKNNMKRDLDVTLSRPGSQARQEFFKELYKNTPYGNIYPTKEMIDKYTINDVRNFYTKNLGAQRTNIYVVGQFVKSEIDSTVKKYFSNWKKGPAIEYPDYQPKNSSTVKIIDRPNAPQSTIYYGLPTIDAKNKDFIALDVMNSLLGGSFGSRITSNIREDKGYTYSPRSSIDINYNSSIWYESADVTTEHTGASINEIKKEIEKLQNEAPSEEELQGIKNYESGIFVLQNSTPYGIINRLNFVDTHNLPNDYLDNYIENIQNVTPDKIQNLTKKYINPEKMTLVIVGDKTKVVEQIPTSFDNQVLKK